MSEVSYRESVDQERITLIREICRELPTACSEFIRSLTVTTSTFTRLAYTFDMRAFFRYLTAERAAFADKPLYAFDDDDLARITVSDIQNYADYLTLYYTQVVDENDQLVDVKRVNHELAIKRKLCSLRSFFEFLFVESRIPANITTLVPLPKVHEKPILRLSQIEVERLLNEARTGENMSNRQQAYQKQTGARDYALLMLLLGTGIRVSECVGINLNDISFIDNAVLVTRKGGNQVILYYPDQVRDALKEYYDQRAEIETLEGHEQAFFLSLQRRRITQRSVEKLVKKYAAIAAPLKPRISPHKLRSTFGTNLYHATGDIYLVASVLGHSSVDTTRKHYADQTDERRQMAAEYVHLPVPDTTNEERNRNITETEDSITAVSDSPSELVDPAE